MNEFVSMTTLTEKYQRSKRTIFRWIKDNKFPRPVLTGEGGAETMFLLADVLQWEEDRIAESRKEAA